MIASMSRTASKFWPTTCGPSGFSDRARRVHLFASAKGLKGREKECKNGILPFDEMQRLATTIADAGEVNAKNDK
jgi:hypothetical protein